VRFPPDEGGVKNKIPKCNAFLILFSHQSDGGTPRNEVRVFATFFDKKVEEGKQR